MGQVKYKLSSEGKRKKKEKNKRNQVMQRQLLITSHKQENAQPDFEQWLPSSKLPPSVFIAEHGMDYVIGQFGSAVLMAFPLNFFCTPIVTCV